MFVINTEWEFRKGEMEGSKERKERNTEGEKVREAWRNTEHERNRSDVRGRHFGVNMHDFPTTVPLFSSIHSVNFTHIL